MPVKCWAVLFIKCPACERTFVTRDNKAFKRKHCSKVCHYDSMREPDRPKKQRSLSYRIRNKERNKEFWKSEKGKKLRRKYYAKKQYSEYFEAYILNKQLLKESKNGNSNS